MAVIPCFLCGTDLAIRTDKNKKRYFICNECGVQAFVRTEKGITRLDELLKNLRTRDFEFTKHRQSFFQICAVLNEISDLKKEITKQERQRSFFSPDADKERAIKALKARVSALLSTLEKYAKTVQPIAN
jgi:predicted RNA-binding Zn-ribbon protein involved in translation (DUF1610 family)